MSILICEMVWIDFWLVKLTQIQYADKKDKDVPHGEALSFLIGGIGCEKTDDWSHSAV